jgi:hypothetical protein
VTGFNKTDAAAWIDGDRKIGPFYETIYISKETQ